MRGKLIAVAAVALLAAAVTADAIAAPAARQSATVDDFETGAPVGAASLVRNERGLSMTLETSGLPAGEAVTVWWVIFNADESVHVTHAAGHVVGGAGVASFGSRLAEGNTSNCPFAEMCAGLADARTADVLLVVREHGDATPGMIPKQIHSFEDQCEVCEDTQGAFFPAP